MNQNKILDVACLLLYGEVYTKPTYNIILRLARITETRQKVYFSGILSNHVPRNGVGNYNTHYNNFLKRAGKRYALKNLPAKKISEMFLKEKSYKVSDDNLRFFNQIETLESDEFKSKLIKLSKKIKEIEDEVGELDVLKKLFMLRHKDSENISSVINSIIRNVPKRSKTLVEPFKKVIELHKVVKNNRSAGVDIEMTPEQLVFFARYSEAEATEFKEAIKKVFEPILNIKFNNDVEYSFVNIKKQVKNFADKNGYTNLTLVINNGLFVPIEILLFYGSLVCSKFLVRVLKKVVVKPESKKINWKTLETTINKELKEKIEKFGDNLKELKGYSVFFNNFYLFLQNYKYYYLSLNEFKNANISKIDIDEDELKRVSILYGFVKSRDFGGISKGQYRRKCFLKFLDEFFKIKSDEVDYDYTFEWKLEVSDEWKGIISSLSGKLFRVSDVGLKLSTLGNFGKKFVDKYIKLLCNKNEGITPDNFSDLYNIPFNVFLINGKIDDFLRFSIKILNEKSKEIKSGITNFPKLEELKETFNAVLYSYGFVTNTNYARLARQSYFKKLIDVYNTRRQKLISESNEVVVDERILILNNELGLNIKIPEFPIEVEETAEIDESEAELEGVSVELETEQEEGDAQQATLDYSEAITQIEGAENFISIIKPFLEIFYDGTHVVELLKKTKKKYNSIYNNIVLSEKFLKFFKIVLKCFLNNNNIAKNNRNVMLLLSLILKTIEMYKLKKEQSIFTKIGRFIKTTEDFTKNGMTQLLKTPTEVEEQAPAVEEQAPAVEAEAPPTITEEHILMVRVTNILLNSAEEETKNVLKPDTLSNLFNVIINGPQSPNVKIKSKSKKELIKPNQRKLLQNFVLNVIAKLVDMGITKWLLFRKINNGFETIDFEEIKNNGDEIVSKTLKGLTKSTDIHKNFMFFLREFLFSRMAKEVYVELRKKIAELARGEEPAGAYSNYVELVKLALEQLQE